MGRATFAEGEGKGWRWGCGRDGVDGGVPEREGIGVDVRTRAERESERGEVGFGIVAVIGVETDAFLACGIGEVSEVVDAFRGEVGEGGEEERFEGNWVEVVGELVAGAIEPCVAGDVVVGDGDEDEAACGGEGAGVGGEGEAGAGVEEISRGVWEFPEFVRGWSGEGGVPWSWVEEPCEGGWARL